MPLSGATNLFKTNEITPSASSKTTCGGVKKKCKCTNMASIIKKIIALTDCKCEFLKIMEQARHESGLPGFNTSAVMHDGNEYLKWGQNILDCVLISENAAKSWLEHVKSDYVKNIIISIGVDNINDISIENVRTELDGSLTQYCTLPNGQELRMNIPPGEWAWIVRH